MRGVRVLSRQQVIEPMFRMRGRRWRRQTEIAKSWRSDRDEQRGNGLDAVREIGQARLDQVASRQAGQSVDHDRII